MTRIVSIFTAITLGASVLLAVMFSAAFYEPYQLRRVLTWFTVVMLWASLISTIVGLVLCRKEISERWHSISPRGRRVALGALGGLTLVLLTVPPTTNRIYYDEQIYQNIAQSITFTGSAFMCNECAAEAGRYEPAAREYNKQPQGHPFFISLFFRLFGVSNETAHVANWACYLLGAIGVYWFVLLVFESEMAALLGAVFFGLTPTVLIWSKTTAAEPYAAGFAALALAGVAYFSRKESAASLLIAAGLLTFAVNGRPESLLIVIPAALTFLAIRPRDLLEPKTLWLGTLFIILSSAEILHLFAVQNESWGARGDQERFSLAIVTKNWLTNGGYLVFNREYPIAFTALAALGIALGMGFRRRLVILSWFAYTFVTFLFFYAGSYRFGADIRFSVVSAAPLAIAAALGASWLCGRIREKYRSLATVTGVVVLAIHLSTFLPFVRAIGEEAADCRYDVAFAKEFAAMLPPESIVLSHDPNMWLVWGKNSAQASLAASNPAHVTNDFSKRYRGGVYFHQGYWCSVSDPVQAGFCRALREMYHSIPVAERTARGKTYGLYRLDFTTPPPEKVKK